MDDSKFYLYKHKNGIYYAELILDGVRITRSTRETKRDKAAIKAARWISDGVPYAQGKKPLNEIVDYKALLQYAHNGDIDETQAVEITRALYRRGLISMITSRASQNNKKLIDLILEYWDYNNSLALKDKRAHGKKVLKSTCSTAIKVIKGKWQPYFKDILLNEITRKEIKTFGLHLSESGFSGKYVNNILFYGTIALKWAYQEKIILENITDNVGGFIGGFKKRDIPTDAEIELLSNCKYWQSDRAYAGFMLAYTSGLRNSEMRALRRQDIVSNNNIINIKYSYNDKDGLKSTKTNEERKIYILQNIRNLLINLLKRNPHDESSGIEPYFQRQYIFYSDFNADKPFEIRVFPYHLKIAMKNAGIETAGRRIDFHSLRHYFTKKWADNTGDLRKVSKLTGHKGLEMTAHYADHTTDDEILSAKEQAEKIFKFPEVKGA